MNATNKLSVVRNVLVLISGTSASQFVLIAISPILTRIYTPEDFAVLALFSALLQLSSSFASGRYELAVFLPKEDAEIFKVTLLAIIVSAFMSILILIFVFLGHNAAADWWNMPELDIWLWLLPIAVFFEGIFTATQSANIRLGSYKVVAGAKIFKAIIQGSIQVFFGLLSASPGVLVVGRTIASFAGNSYLIRPLLSRIGGVPPWNWAELVEIARRYRQFPFFSAPAGFLNICHHNLLNLALPVLLGPATLGFYSLAMRVLGAPLLQIADPIAQVYMREASEELRRTGAVRNSFMKGLVILTCISTVLFGLLYLIVEPVFTIVFGDKWAVAGQYAAIMIPLFAARFIVSPLARTASLTDVRFALMINTLLLLVGVLVLWISSIYQWEANKLLHWLSLSLGAVYLSYLPILYWLATGHGKQEKVHV